MLMRIARTTKKTAPRQGGKVKDTSRSEVRSTKRPRRKKTGRTRT
jgi:hypothetical protein